jgi:hypothetical protein
MSLTKRLLLCTGAEKSLSDAMYDCRIALHFQTHLPVNFLSVNTTPETKLPSKTNQTPWPESASELYRPSDRRLSTKLVPTFADNRRLSTKLVPTFADRGCNVVRVTISMAVFSTF